MVTLVDVFYPSGDGEPVAESYLHFYVLALTFVVLQQYLAGQRATVLANQFLYYTQGIRDDRVAPDVMVIFDIEPGGRDSYKLWEEKQVPAVVFEMTSKRTEKQDRQFKKDLYERLGVQEYWLFDPKGEWIAGRLLGYRLGSDAAAGGRAVYHPIDDAVSEQLGLQLVVEDSALRFVRLDTGEKLPIPVELLEQLAEARHRAEQAERQMEWERQRAQRLAERLRALGIDPDV
ncbi:Uma2 family endonuclease [Gloeobacter morelensis]|uniref:Uma2 family endonuclease n=1 Tax=Gloeobacter morelensis MG652769 TaxID=2781736 RepID=A0ABY3PR63_9CYAN|nr:Uma2 family endonuclease [Gloeobacter morelensis]UFP95917.1 Uma2 family endonuclease [Gloeobacter morelensis MG652769]